MTDTGTGTTGSLRARMEALREGPAAYADLEALWADCAPVRAEEVLGAWRGSDFPSAGHPVSGMLQGARWHGKRFDSLSEAHPLICRDDAGELVSNAELGKGLASLWDVEFRGEVTASMVYDGQPVIDHFKVVDRDGTAPTARPTTLLGVMNGKGVTVGGQHFFFVLEREG